MEHPIWKANLFFSSLFNNSSSYTSNILLFWIWANSLLHFKLCSLKKKKKKKRGWKRKCSTWRLKIFIPVPWDWNTHGLLFAHNHIDYYSQSSFLYQGPYLLHNSFNMDDHIWLSLIIILENLYLLNIDGTSNLESKFIFQHFLFNNSSSYTSNILFWIFYFESDTNSLLHFQYFIILNLSKFTFTLQIVRLKKKRAEYANAQHGDWKSSFLYRGIETHMDYYLLTIT